jgi:hypothetical protein
MKLKCENKLYKTAHGDTAKIAQKKGFSNKNVKMWTILPYLG